MTLTEEKQAKCVKLLNELNESFSMLKYYINGEGNLVLTCSIPAGDDKFDPALLFALLDQVKVHLDTNYSKINDSDFERIVVGLAINRGLRL